MVVRHSLMVGRCACLQPAWGRVGRSCSLKDVMRGVGNIDEKVISGVQLHYYQHNILKPGRKVMGKNVESNRKTSGRASRGHPQLLTGFCNAISKAHMDTFRLAVAEEVDSNSSPQARL